MPPVFAGAASPTLVPLLLVGLFVLLASAGLLAVLARSQGPGPAEVAVAYERAWDRLDFATVWQLSSPTLRDGRSRDQFVRDKQAAYREERGALAELVRSVRPERVEKRGPVARVLTRLELRDGHSVVDEVLLERDGAFWLVSAYHLAPRRAGPSPPEET
jgi:hypothetical protein